ncbi:MAG: hypothetical protein GVY23_07620, partial [Spirochaetes bacterium]|nr:hypothetical protein [Spirochaetota bacterium]
MSEDIGETAREEERNIQVHYEPETGTRYLIARDEFGATWGRLYLNDRGTPLKRARRKRVATLFEIAADNLSDVYRA